MSAFLALRDAAVAALLQAPAIAGGYVKAGRGSPLPAEKTAGVFVRLGRNPSAAPFVGDERHDWETELIVRLVARAAPGGDGEAAVDALLDQVYARLAAATPYANADAWTVAPGLAYDVDELDAALGAAELRLRIRHRTASGSLAAAP